MRPKLCQYLSLLADTMGLLGAGWHSRGSILLVLQQSAGAQCNHLLQLHAEPLVPGHHHRHCRQWPKLEHHSEFFLPPCFVILHPLMRNAIVHMRCISCLCVQRLSPLPLFTAQQPGLWRRVHLQVAHPPHVRLCQGCFDNQFSCNICASTWESVTTVQLYFSLMA